MVFYWVFGWLVGMIVGVSLAYIVSRTTTTFGTLRIDRSNPKKDVYRYDINGDITELPNKKRIVLSIDPNADLSQD